MPKMFFFSKLDFIFYLPCWISERSQGASKENSVSKQHAHSFLEIPKQLKRTPIIRLLGEPKP